MPHPIFAASAARLLLDVSLKSLPLFAVAGLACWGLRRVSAAARHALWLLVFLGLLCLPVFCVLLPRWSAPVLPAARPRAVPTEAAVPAPEPTNAPVSSNAPASHVPLPPPTPDAPVVSQAPMPASPAEAIAPTQTPAPAPPPTLGWVCLAWLAGALLALGRTLLGLAAASRLVRRCRPVTNGPIVEAADAARQALNLSCPLFVREGPVAVPMTCGVRRPLILLPSGAASWPGDRLRAVLLHEAAHIQRLDWATTLFAQGVCALYWFHPLTWLAAGRLRAEAEAACDDLVLTHGVPAPDYAAHLLEIVRALASRRQTLTGTVAMAHRQEVAGRLRTILDGHKPRGGVSRRRLALAGLAMLAILVPLAAVAVVRRVAAAPRIALPVYLPKPAIGTPQMPPANPQQVKTTVSPFTLTATLDRNVAEGQPAVLDLSLHNGGVQSLIIDGSAFEQASFQFTITDAAGQPVPRTADGNRVLTPPMAVSANATVIISPGQTIPYQFNLARLFDLSHAGDYAVHVTRTLRPQVWSSQGIQNQPLVTLTVPPLKVRMVETADAASGPIDATPPRGATYLYLTTPYSPGVSRYRVAEDGSISFSLDPGAPPGVSPPNPPSVQTYGMAPGAPIATPDGRFVYWGNNNGTISQFRVGDDGVLVPLVPATVPVSKGPGALLMDPRGHFLYDLDGLAYPIGPNGRLNTAASVANSLIPASALGSWGVTPNGSLLYICNGLTYGYRFSGDGRMVPLPVPTAAAAGGQMGRDNAIAFMPSGQIAFIGTSTQGGTAYFDRVTAMRVAADGSMTPLPGSSVQTAPPSPVVNQVIHDSTFLAVDPHGRFLFVGDTQGTVSSYRIGSSGRLTALGTTQAPSDITSLFFIPGRSLAYAVSRNPPALLAFRTNDKQGLVPADVDMPSDAPFGAALAVGTAPGSDRWGAAAGGLQIALRLPATTLPAIQPIIVTVLLRNVTTRPLSLGQNGDALSSLGLTVTGPPAQITGGLRGLGENATATVPLLAAGRDLLDAPTRNGPPFVLPPGGVRAYRLTLSRLADMTVAGFYTVQVSRALPGGATASSPVVTLLREGPFNGINWYGSGVNRGGIGTGSGLSVL